LAVADSAGAANALVISSAADVVMVCGWYFLLPPAVLESGPCFLGIHNSLLPKYRGGAPLVWAMINGEPRVGSSLFGFTPGMDDGPVHQQVAVEPGADDTVGDVLAALEARFVIELPEAWKRIVAGNAIGAKQNHAAATYCGQRLPRDGRIDWRLPADRLHDFVRAQSRPYPGAFTADGERTIHLWRTRPFAFTYHGTPGQVLARNDDAVIVACGQASAIEVREASDSAGRTALREVFGSLSMRLGHTQ
jgi:methionyl-tRNA formyltransferase